MDADLRAEIEACIARLQRGALTEDHLRSLLDRVGSHGVGPRQSLLYLQARGTSPDSQAIGMMMLRDGRIDQGPSDPADWPYGSVAAAIADGWRVIQFPSAALMMDDRHTYGLGCEFILEKWS